MDSPLFIAGIGTGVGKTIVSAILTEQLSADYWKPVQAGDLHNSDRMLVSRLLSNTRSVCHNERFALKLAASPHKAAAAEGISIKSSDFQLPESNNRLVVEGAGGLMVPLSNNLLMVDLIQLFSAEAVLVIRDYLGCINHSLLSIEALERRAVPIRQIIISGNMDEKTKEILKNYFPVRASVVHLPELEQLTRAEVLKCPELLTSI